MDHDRRMALDDEEAEDINYFGFRSVGAERIPMKTIDKLSDIWIPASLLKNRKKYVNINSNKPAIFHTLEKNLQNSFSIYDESLEETENLPTNDFGASEMLDILNFEANDFPDCNEVVTKTEASKGSDAYDCLSSIKSCDSDKSLCPQKESLIPKCLEKKAEILTVCDMNTYDYAQPECSMTRVQRRDENFKTSLDEVYDSGDNFSIENMCSVSEGVLIKKWDSLAGSLNISKESCSPSFEGTLQTENLNGSEINYVDQSKNEEALQMFSVAYKRPVIEETVKKQKSQKKKKNAQKKITLDLFSQNESEYPYPEVDEFYESVMRNANKNDNYKPYENEYPSLKSEVKDTFNESKDKEFNIPEAASKFKDSKETENLIKDNISTSVSLRKPINSNPEIKGIIVVIENLPNHVSESQIQEFVPNGEVRCLYLSKCGQHKIAQISMESDEDAEWIIDCFNGETPFGVGSSILKCYKLS